MPRYTCVFLMEGYDHDGYCSGEDARDHENIHEFVVKTVDKSDLVDSPRELEWTDDGCMSGGSGYCHGFWQSYSFRRILNMTDAPSHMSKADIRRHIASINSQVKKDDDEEEDDFNNEDNVEDNDDNED